MDERMSMEAETPPKRERGRPAGKQFPHVARTYLDQEGVDTLKRIARERKLSEAALLRTLLMEEAERLEQRRKFGPEALRESAERALAYYTNPPEEPDPEQVYREFLPKE